MLQIRITPRLLFAVAAFVAISSSPAFAQVTMDPTRAEFSPSPDHNVTVGGTAVVTSYQLDLFLQGAALPFQSTSLGKPAPDPDGIIRVNLTSILVGWPVPGTVYTADVAAVGPGGTTASAMSNAFGFSPPCTFTASPTSPTFTSAAATGSVTVTTGTGCSWTATSNAPWITITTGASGTGNGTVAYSVAANTGTTQRTGTMTVAGQTITVTQAAPCTYTASPTSQNLTSSGGPGSVTVTTQAACTWTATSNATWITISSGTSGTGNGTVNYTVAANTGTTQRVGTMTVAGQTITVTEAAPCTFTIAPTSQSVPAAGGPFSATVTTQAGCAWTATSNATWLTISAGASGTGNGTVNYNAAANGTATQRIGTLTIAGQTLTVTEAPVAAPTAPTNLTIKP